MVVETHQAVFQWVLQVLAEKKLLKGTTIGVDATTLEANAALRSIVRRDTGERYNLLKYLPLLRENSPFHLALLASSSLVVQGAIGLLTGYT